MTLFHSTKRAKQWRQKKKHLHGVAPLWVNKNTFSCYNSFFFSVKAYKNLSSGRYCKKLPFMSNANALSDISPDDTKSCVHFSLSHIFVDVCLNDTYFPVAYLVITLCYCYCLFNVEYAIVTFYKFYPCLFKGDTSGTNELQSLFMTNVNAFSAYTLTLIVIIANVSYSSA